MIRAIITDIEGTTSSLSFVKDVLFPYARRRIGAYVREHAADPAVRMQLDAVAAEVGEPLTDDQAIARLVQWIDEDRKLTPLKALQGQIWEAGYRDGDFQGHVYDDAVCRLRDWHGRGLRLYVFSSGSVHAQKLLFGHSVAGDLRSLFSGYYDTNIGGKRDAESYRRIARDIGLPPGEILFLSDIREELDAARDAGLHTCWLIRDGTPPAAPPHRPAASFDTIELPD